jgi:type I restriction enzyme, S subunit
MNSHYLKKTTLFDCLESLGRGQSPSYMDEESRVSAINQKCIRNSTIDIFYARAHNARVSVRDSAILREGDICINSTGTGTIGRIGLWSSENTVFDNQYFVDSHITIARPKQDEVNPKYLAALLESEIVQTDIETYCFSGSTNQVELNRSALSSLILEIIPIEAQHSVAAVLSTVDRAIAQTEAIIAKQQRIKTGLMQDLLTKGIDKNGNIRSEETHEFKDSAIGRIPVEWEVKLLHELTNYVIDCPHTTPNFLVSGVLVARTFNIKDGGFDLDNTSFISESEYEQRISRLEPRPRDLIFTREAPVGEAFIIPDGMRVCLGQRTMLIRCNEALLSPSYLLESFYSQNMQMCFDRMVGGTTNPHLNVADVRDLSIKQPSLQEQISIVQTLTKIRLSLTTTQRHKFQLQAAKTGLMQDLLTGKIRVTELLKDQEIVSL